MTSLGKPWHLPEAQNFFASVAAEAGLKVGYGAFCCNRFKLASAKALPIWANVFAQPR